MKCERHMMHTVEMSMPISVLFTCKMNYTPSACHHAHTGMIHYSVIGSQLVISSQSPVVPHRYAVHVALCLFERLSDHCLTGSSVTLLLFYSHMDIFFIFYCLSVCLSCTLSEDNREKVKTNFVLLAQSSFLF